MPTLEQLGSEKYVSLTTYRKDGTPVPTAVWVLPAGAGVAIWTVTDTWKVKRARNNPKVTVAACDVRGNVRGEAVEGRARIGDAAERDHFAGVLGRKYRMLGILGTLRYKLLGQRDRITVIVVDPV
ncbi:PPOX class F420-dependent oxidoreductase [Paractinoplanes lichenicola]|uniref:PPOX class F420-dependent oxidoreductase n=1 Tax=Paractinoplanes lichenicola TaxID=2802976 RepID=A0ABS1W1R8_9ACTN|nr:PPOX class F420-dependent oxidoreductase [Actinoplanes lichenicola]MBL7260678.1 PPOX class F420-dependent oxidoreductase [Actinoplanes lichenicola]